MAVKEIHHVKVVKSGSLLVVPNHMSYRQAAKLCMQMHEQDEEIVSVRDEQETFIWEGALALRKAMDRTFGVTLTQEKMTMMGPIKPAEVVVRTGPGVDDTVTVPWGQMIWPLTEAGIGQQSEEYLETSYSEKNGRMIFCLTGQIKRKWKDKFMELTKLMRAIIEQESIYRAKAVRISFTDSKGATLPMPVPEFMDLSKADLKSIVYSKATEDIIDTYIMTPLRASQKCRDAGIPLKRGVLAAGPYGTGKTLLAQAVGRIGNENGWTFLYIKNATELPVAIRFAQQYEPCVIFAEDLDRAVEGQERTEKVDMILNTLDGIDTKGHEIMTILTTNHLEKVNRAMLRPGRLDVLVNVLPPDAEAVSRLVRIYGRGLIADNADLTKVGDILAGTTPAIIREAVERSKLATIRRTGDPRAVVLVDDLLISAQVTKDQQEALKDHQMVPVHPAEGFMSSVAQRAAQSVVNKFEDEGLVVVKKKPVGA